MLKPVRLAVTGLIFVLPTLASATDLYRVRLPARADLRVILEGGFDLVELHATDPTGLEPAVGAADILIHRDDFSRLRNLGFDPELLQRDVEKAYASQLFPLTEKLSSGPPNFGQGSMGGYYTFAEIVSTIDYYIANYPGIVSQKQALGTSHQGRTIWAFKISDNPNVSENEPRVLFDALHHAREPLSAHTLLWLVDHLATSYGVDPELTQLMNEREIWFVPCVNPDGYEYNYQTDPGGGGMWRKNRRPGGCTGVDLNRNWPTAWGYDNSGSSPDPCSDVYRGPAAGSEPEVAALNSFMTGMSFRTAWSVHSYGEWLVAPYGYRSASPGPVYQEYGADMAAFNGYTHGVGYDLLYPCNGVSMDHYNDVHGAVAFSPEIGTGFWPPISSMVATAQLNLEPGLLMVKYAGSWIKNTGTTLAETSGSGNGAADPGEDLDLVLQVRNKGQVATGGPLQLSLSSGDPMISVLVGSAAGPTLAPLSDGDNSANPLRIHVDAAATTGVTIPLDLTVSADGISHTVQVPVTIGTPRLILQDLFESELGWQAGVPGDNASTGLWERVNPNQVSDGGTITQPGDDATPGGGTHCYVTGNNNSSLGADDVDSGKTTLMSPVFDLTGLAS
ncbi:MAG: M14 family metallopeptidase, partial [Planctomycetota bacterium]